MLRITGLTASSASRRALQAGVQQQCSRSIVRSYTNADPSFSIYTPKAYQHKNRRQGIASKQNRSNRPANPNASQRLSPSSNPSSSMPRSKRVIGLNSPSVPQSALSDTANAHIIHLQKAIDGQNITTIWSAWQSLGRDTHKLGRAEHSKLLRLCSTYASSIQDATQVQEWAARLREFASTASCTGDVDLICAYFRLLLANGQAEDVVHIWEQIVRIRLENGPNHLSDEAMAEPSASETMADEKFVRLDESSEGDRVEAHDMVCLVAFACFHSSRASNFAELFEKVEFGSPFRLFFNMQRAKRLFDSLPAHKNQPPSAASIAWDWKTMQSNLWDVELARGLSSGSGGPQRIARLLGSLFQMRQEDEAYHIFQTAMRAASSPNAWLSLGKLDGSTPPSPSRAQWTESCWSVCLSNFIASGRTELAMDVWTHFQQRQLRPTSRIWNALLDGYGRAKNYTAASQTWSTAIKSARTDSSSTNLPDEQMYTTMINIHFRAKKIEEALALFSDMKAQSTRHGGKLQVQAETFNAVLHGLFFNGRQVQAQELLNEMLSKGPAPNIGTVNTYLRAYARVGDLQSLASTLRLADKLKLTPDVVTFTTVLDALLRKGGESATDSVVKTLDIMASLGVQPNVVTYTAMIKACLVGAEAAQLDMASQSMLGDTTGRSRRQQQSQQEQMSSNDVRIEAALELLDRMVEAKVAPSEITYTALIGGCLQNPDAVAHAFETKSIARHYCVTPKPLKRLGETADTVQRWTRESPDVSLSLLLLEPMKSRGLPPSATTFRYLVEGLCSTRTDQAAFTRSMDLIDDMLLRSPLSEPSRQLGPFASSVLKGKDVHPPSMYAPSHRSWITIFGSLLDRLENGPRDKVATTTCARALATAIRLVREMGSLTGTEGGMSLSRLVERAASHITRHLR
ncbi:uncharacterized protein UTRI_05714_B [Ustilago trichophora]|uniref:Uncharacterized protein n=1 Tax=Ustilago trichophora TaxID=86804 RepID=A0A5C3EU04_9BASI|nr:uncharacterized protein UTRI_05714_B [Ustilago trichophora]